MWIKLYGGQLKPNIKYSVIPQEEYATLKASHGKLVEATEDLYDLYKKKCTSQHVKFDRIVKMHRKVKQALAEAEKI